MIKKWHIENKIIDKSWKWIIDKNQGVFAKHCAPEATKSKKLFLASTSKSRSLALVLLEKASKGFISGVCMPDMKSLSLTAQKL